MSGQVYNEISYMDNRNVSLVRPFVNKLGISKADYRICEFLAKCELPITEDQIIAYYSKNVQRYLDKEQAVYNPKIKGYEFKITPVTKSYQKTLALNWFDRSLGRVLRRGILSDQGMKKIRK